MCTGAQIILKNLQYYYIRTDGKRRFLLYYLEDEIVYQARAEA